MVCSACGTPAVAGVNFCARCGAAITPDPQFAPQSVPPPPVAAHYGVPYAPILRVQRNLQTMGILWCVYAAYRVIGGLIGIFFLHTFVGGGFPFGHHFPGNFSQGFDGWGSGHGLFGALLPIIALTVIASAVLAAASGWALLNRKPWARVLAIIAAVLALLKFPFGTALGIYTLWVLAPGQSGAEWDAIADRT